MRGTATSSRTRIPLWAHGIFSYDSVDRLATVQITATTGTSGPVREHVRLLGLSQAFILLRATATVLRCERTGPKRRLVTRSGLLVDQSARWWRAESGAAP
jgi:hypothetical protein